MFITHPLTNAFRLIELYHRSSLPPHSPSASYRDLMVKHAGQKIEKNSVFTHEYGDEDLSPWGEFA
jgi:hypothetical protein